MNMPDTDITSLFDAWNVAIKSGEPKNVSALYEKNAILLPTVSNKVRHNHKEIEDYFVYFIAKGPKGFINESNIRIFGNIAINSGVYTITFSDGNLIRARFTFVYHWNGHRWLIEEHHSSAMPEG